MPRRRVSGSRRRPSIRRRSLLYMVALFIIILYLAVLAWNFGTLTRTAEQTEKCQPLVDSGGATQTWKQRHENGDSTRVLILISSAPRAPETVCRTIHSVLQNFQAKRATHNILVHRYGDLSCEKNILASPQVTLRQYPRHVFVSNNEQKRDYLKLMEEGTQMVDDSFSHIMFLDDDVELCPGYANIIEKACTAFPTLGLGHFGRGGSGILVPAENLLKLRDSMKRDRKKNVDKSMLDWALRKTRICTIRPVAIQMRHIGLNSSLYRGETWEDVDKCGAPANNFAWQSMSESASSDFFSEYCLNNPLCSPFSSQDHDRKTCIDGYSGEDCGIPSDGNTCIRQNKVAAVPMVALLSGDDPKEDVLADSTRHNLINLYVIGNQEETKWLAPNVHTSTRDASVAFHEDLKDTARWGEMAWSRETIFIQKVLQPQNFGP
jgi:hypothetical protein